MKKLVTVVFITISLTALAQDSLQIFNFSRNHIKNTGMEVLGSWAAANITVGAIGWAGTSGNTRYFYQMNTLWNIANLGAAIAGYTSAQKDKNRQYTPQESLTEQHKIENIFLFNGILDVTYIGAGFYLKHHGEVKRSDQSSGYGSAIILQGAFLLLFDGTMYSSEKHAGSKLKHFLQQNPIIFDGKTIGMALKL